MCAFAPLMIAATGLSALGSIMQGNQALAAGNAQQAAYYQQADADRLASGYEATREFEKGRRVQGHATTQIAGSGVAMAGSPTEALIDNAEQNQLDIEAIRFGSQIRQGQLKTQGDLALFKGQQGQQAGYIGAATSAASGLASLYAPSKAVKMGGPASWFS
jgi:hypothetical protein